MGTVIWAACSLTLGIAGVVESTLIAGLDLQWHSTLKIKQLLLLFAQPVPYSAYYWLRKHHF